VSRQANPPLDVKSGIFKKQMYRENLPADVAKS
jgi:hypothetical protein